MTQSPSNGRENGFVLIIVLGFIASLSILSAAFSFSTRIGIKLMETEIISAKDRALLDAGIELAALRLSMTDRENRWQADGSTYRQSVGGIKLDFRIFDHSGRIDINKSDPQLLMGLLRQFIHDPKRAQKLTDQITAGRNQERARSERELIKNSARQVKRRVQSTMPEFMDVSQLQAVTGMSPNIYRQIRPYITVHSDDGRINPLTASRKVLLAIPGMNNTDLDNFLEARRRDPGDETLVERLPSSTRKWMRKGVGRAVNVLVSVTSRPGHSAKYVSATIMPEADKNAPYRVLRRRLISITPEFREAQS